MKSAVQEIRSASLGLLIVVGAPVFGLNVSQERIQTQTAVDAFGGGTGVIVGVTDNGVNNSHPALAGNDSQGSPRLVAQGDFAQDGFNSPADSTGHGTAVAGIILSSDPQFPGGAPGARYVNARVSDVGLTSTTNSVLNGMDFAFTNGANIFNLSLNEAAGGSDDGSSRLSRIVDYYTSALGIPVVASAGNAGQQIDPSPTSPADAFNVIAVGATGGPTFDQLSDLSATGPASDGRSLPHILAPGENITAPNRDYEGVAPDFVNQTGTSFSAPHVTGILASQLAYGLENGLNTSPLVLRATLLNAAEKITLAGTSWAPGSASTTAGLYTVTQPLSPLSGAGQVDASALVDQYLAGESQPGSVGSIGWDFGFIGENTFVEYEIGDVIEAGSSLTATLNWYRQVRRFDEINGNGLIDDRDDFLLTADLANLDLLVYRDGVLIAQSIASLDTIEHLFLQNLDPGHYTIRVSRLFVDGSQFSEPYALAWRVQPIPEPSSLMTTALLVLALRRPHRRRGETA